MPVVKRYLSEEDRDNGAAIKKAIAVAARSANSYP
jgi:hypothetical protein